MSLLELIGFFIGCFGFYIWGFSSGYDDGYIDGIYDKNDERLN